MPKINDRDETEPTRLLAVELLCPDKSYSGPTYVIARVTPSFMEQVRAARLAVVTAKGRCMHIDGEFYWEGGGIEQGIEDELLLVTSDEFSLVGYTSCLDVVIEMPTDFFPLDKLERWFAGNEPIFYLAGDPDALQRKADAMVTAILGGLREADFAREPAYRRIELPPSLTIH